MVAAHYKKDDLLNCWTSSSDISGYRADFHEGHGTVGAGQGRGMACVNLRHGMREERRGHGMLCVNRPYEYLDLTARRMMTVVLVAVVVMVMEEKAYRHPALRSSCVPESPARVEFCANRNGVHVWSRIYKGFQFKLGLQLSETC